MKKLDLGLLNARSADLEQVVKEANYMENLGTQGKSPEGIIQKAKESLGIDPEKSVIAEWEDKFTEINNIKRALIKTNSLTNDLITAKLIGEQEVEALNSIEAKLSELILSSLDLDMDDLYLDEEE